VKEKIKKILRLVSVCAITLLTGCNEEIAEAVKNVPTPLYGFYDVLTDRGVTDSLREAQVKIATWYIGGAHAIQYHDGTYITITKKSLSNFSGWFANAFSPIIGANGEATDCDNIAFLYRYTLSATTIKNKGDAEILCGVLMVKQMHDFGNVMAGPDDKPPVLHALNIIKTSDTGWYVVEPQTGTSCPLANYPNKSYIFRIIF
jgi:hypothetical protein